jgi:hypothetical protein
VTGTGIRHLRRTMFGLCATSALVAAEVLTACATSHGPSDASRAPTATPAAASTIDPRILAAHLDVMTAYNGYIAAETSASQTADFTSSDLPKYMGDPLLGSWVASIFHIHMLGDVQTGAVVSHPQLVSLQLSDTSGTATVRDCLDQSGIDIVNAKSGKSAKFNRVNKVLSTATVTLGPNGRWRVTQVDAKAAVTC